MTNNSFQIKLHIFHNLGKLLKETNIDDISTKYLCQECNISRQTFYRYFQDKYAVVNWHFDLLSEDTLKQVGRTLTWQQAHNQLFTKMHSESSIYKYAHISNDYNSLSKYSYRSTKNMYIETLIKYKNTCPTKSLLFQADAVALFCTELATNWCNNGMKQSPEEFTALVDTVIPYELKDIFEHDLPLLSKPFTD